MTFGVERDLAHRGIDTARTRGASYADVRFVRRAVEDAVVKNGYIDTVDRSDTFGFGVRVIADGAWGFAASQVVTPQEVDRVAALAVEIAKASAITKEQDAALAPVTPAKGTYRTNVEVDPFAVPFEDRVGLLLAADGAMRTVTGLRTTRANYEIWREDKLFVSSEGADLEQTIFETGCGISAEAVGDSELQIRSYPAAGGRTQNQAGWEFVTKWDLPGHAPKIAEEAVALLTAKQCPQDVRTTLVIGDAQLMLQVHESCGHPIELDRALGTEAAYAGTSFLTTDKLGSFRYGSEKVNMRIDSTTPGGLGTFGWDDEGVPAQAVERDDARRRLGAPPAHPDDERLAHARRRGHARRPHRRHRRRHLHGDEPLVVDRRQAPQLPVRDADRVGDQGRQARRDAAQPHVHRHDAGVLGVV